MIADSVEPDAKKSSGMGSRRRRAGHAATGTSPTYNPRWPRSFPDMTRIRWMKLGSSLMACAACAGIAHAAGTNAANACALPPQAAAPGYRDRIEAINRELGVPDGYANRHRLSPVPEASSLVVAGHDVRGRPVRLEPRAAAALRGMIAAAKTRGVELQLVSGYRSADYQAGLLRDKLRRGMTLDSALGINTPPGYSEHQSGCAVDLTTPHSVAADAGFARTPAYAWLTRHAGEFGFHLSYPSGNPNGIEFEPWHWRYVTPDRAEVPGAAPPPHPVGG
ncbi:MAG: M15 family metallopeptidase [Proteobacteria bacterium]|nr:M15 family metallopeptidase [Pseudomonadota bacterium]